MNIKRYEASSTQEALQMVKKEMGVDAVILRTRRVSSPNGGSKIEVTAAVDYEPLNARSTEDGNRALSGNKDWQNLENEIRDIKDLLLDAGAHFFLNPDSCFNHDLRHRYTNLKRFGLRTEIIADIMGKAVAGERKKIPQSQQIKESLYHVLSRISFEDVRQRKEKPQVYSFIGPTGVGKTTSLAKLAALSAVSKGEKAALITLDTFRIAAVAQLKTYAQIMNIPLEVVMSRKELETALKKHQGLDSIYIDTAGRSPKMAKDIQKLKSFFDIPAKVHHFLVLSATTGYQDLIWAEDQFRVFPYGSYIFTKLDETRDTSSMFNFLVSKEKPVSYLTTGQQVPEDIEAASKKKLAALLLSRMRGVAVDNSRDEEIVYGSSCRA